MSEVKFQTQLINDQKLSAECVDVACPVSRGAKEEKGETCQSGSGVAFELKKHESLFLEKRLNNDVLLRSTIKPIVLWLRLGQQKSIVFYCRCI